MNKTPFLSIFVISMFSLGWGEAYPKGEVLLTFKGQAHARIYVEGPLLEELRKRRQDRT